MTLASNLNRDYYRNQRRSLSKHISEDSHIVLDVGCGAGYFGAYLKESGKAAKVYGVELFKEAAYEAQQLLDGVICADLDSLNISRITNNWDNITFDYIVCADVLEHVKEPWQTLAALKDHLKPSGKMIISIPNVRHWSVICSLLFRGRWDYQNAGILDRTHLRFFTKSTAKELIAGSGFNLCKCEPLIGKRWSMLSKLTAHLFDEFLAVQYVYVARL